jgi:hypothetical protein
MVGRQLPEVACGLSCARGRPIERRTTAVTINICLRVITASAKLQISDFGFQV